MKKGISLIVLVITIIILAILAATSIAVLTDGGLIEYVSKTAFKSRVSGYIEELSTYHARRLSENKLYNYITINASKEGYTNINSIITGITEEDEAIFVIEEGKLKRLSIASDNQKEIATDLGIEIGEPKLVPGLYDANDVLLAAWEELINDYGMDITIDYTGSTSKTSTTSPYYILNNNTDLSTGTKLIIAEDVSRIGSSAFDDCRGLTHITISDRVSSIGESAFDYCLSLTDLTIGNGVTSIGDYAFVECTNLTNLTIGNSVKRIGELAFGLCESLTNVTIPDSVESIGRSAFDSCTGLSTVVLGNGLTSIPESAFVECRNLTNLTIGNNVTSIEGQAFFECEKLANVTIPNSVTSIANMAFSGCVSLNSVTFENVEGWYVASSLTGPKREDIDVTNAATNAMNLIDSWETDYLIRK